MNVSNEFALKKCPLFIVILFHLRLAQTVECIQNLKIQNKLGEDEKVSRPDCTIFKDIGVNDLSVNDVVARSATSNLVCIKARFSLAIKVEESLEHKSSHPHYENGHNEDLTNGFNDKSERILMGFLPLDSVVKVEDNCYDPKSLTDTSGDMQGKDEGQTPTLAENYPELTIQFDCGRLTFTFAKDEESYYVSSIKGAVNLDANTERAFESNQPVFATKDLKHHFKYDPLIEVKSEASSKAYILSANFYKTEMEAFRNTTSREFIRPPEDAE